MEPNEIIEKMRSAKAGWEDGLGLRGMPVQSRPTPPASPQYNEPHLQKSEQKIFFPTPPTAATVENQNVATGGLDYAFWLTNATITVDGQPSNRVSVFPGKVNDVFPTGMDEDTPKIVDIAEPDGTIIYVQVTFDPDTNEILTRTIESNLEPDIPEDGFDNDGNGIFTIWLGKTSLSGTEGFLIVQFFAGYINFELSAGSVNGNQAVQALFKFSEFIDLTLAPP